MTTTKSLGYYNFIWAMDFFYLNSPKGYTRKIINAQTDNRYTPTLYARSPLMVSPTAPNVLSCTEYCER